jgi:hypothetical protein
MPASENLEPLLGCFRFDVAEAVRKRRGSSFQFSENPSDSVSISVATHLKSEPGSLKRSLEVLSAIHEKHGGFDIVFLMKFAQEDFCKRGRSCRK